MPLSYFFLLLLLLLTTTQAFNFTSTFFFGDSSLDTGNNNFITTIYSIFRTNHHPYGLSFMNKTATGRCSDGLLVSDLLTSALNIKSLSPPYLDPNLSVDELRTGVTFASAGAGYDELTSRITRALSIPTQVEKFGEYARRLEEVVGEEERRRVVEGGLVLFSAGTNDVLFNYYGLPTRRVGYYMSEYQDYLHGILKDALKVIDDHIYISPADAVHSHA